MILIVPEGRGLGVAGERRPAGVHERGGHRGERAGGPRAGGDARRRRVGKRVTSTRVSTRSEIRGSRFLAASVVSGADAKRALNVCCTYR